MKNIFALCLLLSWIMAAHGQPVEYAIVTQSVINMRQNPSVAAEMGTQALMGTPVHILKTDHGWKQLMTPDGYVAWATSESVQPMSLDQYKEWNASRKVIVTHYFTVLHSEPSENSPVVSDVVWGDVIRLTGERGDYFHLLLPDGRIAFLQKSYAVPFDQWIASRQPTAGNIIATAKCFVGFPYLWGGTSIKGMDCSGFTKTCFFLNGVVLRRDAWQQAMTGDSVNISKGFSELRPGDLLFFGSKKNGKRHVSHVGLYIGNGEFIHSSGMVHISSLAPSSPKYDAYNTKRLLCARRLLTRIDKDSGIVSIARHPFYLAE
ncbi:NlpC/P60 family protein [Microbacter margulisiae]|uniref:SH3-like domain-containing protein n=1 Tax=Microbacter margulisiae TaxID=1350067 RepID=A0A7W5DU05_9PORP|nr:NlpC/P60 family protein [Microbacter margulisiae]MBB3188203.1 SH3-like domain-containing protein [Microbacter margulisiae]